MASDITPELTDEEQSLIDQHLEFYNSLASGKRKPATKSQRHFVAVCSGRAKAETPHELAYIKYGRWLRSSEQANNRSSESERHAEWCSDRDWKRMRKGNYADMKKRARE